MSPLKLNIYTGKGTGYCHGTPTSDNESLKPT